MLGLSAGEMAAVVAMGVMAFGPKDVPRIARGAGKLAGRAMGYLFAARDRLRGVADRAELIQLQTEVRETVAKLQEIKRDALLGVQILPDDPSFASRPFMHQDPFPADQSTAHAALHPPQASPPPDTPLRPAPDSSSFPEASYSSAVQGGAAFAPREPATGGGVTNRHSLATNSPGDERRGAESDEGVPVLPVSAQSAGLIPKRKGLPSGSDILLDSLLEERIATQASRFMKGKGYVVRDG